MRIVVQRVSHASVTIEGQCKSSIGKGMLILVGIEESDGQEDIDWLCKKIVNLRIFDDESGVMNKSILKMEVKFWSSVSSRCTLLPRRATVRHTSKPPSRRYLSTLRTVLQRPEQGAGKEIGTGTFGADMKVELLNDGPVTICMDTKNKE